MINEQLHTINDLREDKKELRLEKNEWKAKYEAKDELLQKIVEELANEKMKVDELGQKIAISNIHNFDHNSINSWEVMNQEENLHVIGEVVQEHNI